MRPTTRRAARCRTGSRHRPISPPRKPPCRPRAAGCGCWAARRRRSRRWRRRAPPARRPPLRHRFRAWSLTGRSVRVSWCRPEIQRPCSRSRISPTVWLLSAVRDSDAASISRRASRSYCICRRCPERLPGHACSRSGRKSTPPRTASMVRATRTQRRWPAAAGDARHLPRSSPAPTRWPPRYRKRPSCGKGTKRMCGWSGRWPPAAARYPDRAQQRRPDGGTARPDSRRAHRDRRQSFHRQRGATGLNALITFALRQRVFLALLLPLALIAGAVGFAR